jgi:hypothetical protein
VPHITLRKHPWRSLKTASSERDIPLVGSAYDAARKVIEQDQKFAFPRYCNEAECGANSASTPALHQRKVNVQHFQRSDIR